MGILESSGECRGECFWGAGFSWDQAAGLAGAIQVDPPAGATYAAEGARNLGEEDSYTKRVAVMINRGNHEIRIARINHAPALQNPCSSPAAQRNLHADPWRAEGSVSG